MTGRSPHPKQPPQQPHTPHLSGTATQHNRARDYNPRMHWLHDHRFGIGILADSLTFLGGLLLARDAFNRLQDLRNKRIDEEFRRTFPKLHLTDQEWRDAIAAMGWTVGGFGLIAIGFACQLLLRFAGD
jgi:hypothetical protein